MRKKKQKRILVVGNVMNDLSKRMHKSSNSFSVESDNRKKCGIKKPVKLITRVPKSLK